MSTIEGINVPDKYAVKFFHDREIYEDEILPYGGSTTAEIYDKKEDVLVAIGTAFCHPSDNFNKAKGRQVALGKAIYHLDLKGRRS